MKVILAFIDWYRPGFKAGGTITAFSNLVDHFEEEFSFWIVTRDTDYLDTQPYPDIQQNCWITYSAGEKVFYLSKDRTSISGIQSIIKDTAHDILYINGIYSFYFSILPLIFSYGRNKKVLVNPHGMLSPHALHIKRFRKLSFLKMVNFFGLYKKVFFHVTDQKEKEDVENVIGLGIKILVAAHLPRKVKVSDRVRIKNKKELKLISVARISPEKNTLFAIQVLFNLIGKVKSLNAHITFDLYGSVYDVQYWEQCQKLIGLFPSHIQINYQGTISPIEISAKLMESHFMFMPSTGENFGHSILESLQMGCPVIISDKTPWKGLHNVLVHSKTTSIGWDVSLCDEKLFEEIIIKCVNIEQEAYNELSHNASSFALQYMCDKSIIHDNLNLFNT